MAVPRRHYVIGIVGLSISALWAVLFGWCLLVAAGAAGIGVAISQTQLPLLLPATLLASALMLASVLWRPGALGVFVVAAGLLVLVSSVASEWHPDYRTILTAVGTLALLAAAWAVVALLDHVLSPRHRRSM